MIVLVCFAAQPVLELLGSGQDSAFSLLVWVAGTRLILARRDVLAGFVFALGLCKPQLFVLVPVVLLLQRRYRSLAAWSSAAAVLALVSALRVVRGGAGVVRARDWYVDGVERLATGGARARLLGGAAEPGDAGDVSGFVEGKRDALEAKE